MTNLATDQLIHGDPDCRYKHLAAKVAPSIDPDAQIDVACFMTTDTVDADDEVLLPGGIDLSRFDKNPVVMLCHAYGQPGCYYPLPVGKAEWTKKRPRGVLAGVRFTDKTEMGREVKALFSDDMLRSFSVGFVPVEQSPMTKAEADSRPDWKAAYERTKGHIRVYREWLLIELSVAPIPSNADALVTTYKAKGILVPRWLELTSRAHPQETPTMPTADPSAVAVEGGETPVIPVEPAPVAETPPVETEKTVDAPVETAITAVITKDMADGDGDSDDGMETMAFKPRDHVVAKSGVCGTVKSVHTSGTHASDGDADDMVATKDMPVAKVDMHDDQHMPTGKVKAMACKDLSMVAAAKAMAEGSGTSGGYTVAPHEEPDADDKGLDADGDNDGDGDTGENDEEAKGFSRGDHVKMKAPHYKGVGVVQGVYTRGHVPNVDQDMMGTAEEPAARVRAYKVFGDGHVPTDDHVGVKTAHMTKMAEPMKAPTKAKASASTVKAAPEPATAVTPTPKSAAPLPPLTVLSDQQIQERQREQIDAIPKMVAQILEKHLGIV